MLLSFGRGLTLRNRFIVQMCRDPKKLAPKEYIVLSVRNFFFKPATERTHVIKHTTYEFGSHMTTDQRTNTSSTPQCTRHCVNDLEIRKFITFSIVRESSFNMTRGGGGGMKILRGGSENF